MAFFDGVLTRGHDLFGEFVVVVSVRLAIHGAVFLRCHGEREDGPAERGAVLRQTPSLATAARA